MTLQEVLEKYDEVYGINVCNIYFVFRPISRREFKLLIQNVADGFEFEDAVCELCVLLPENFDFQRGPAGLPAMLALSILGVSGFANDELSKIMIDQARANMAQDLEKQLDAVIMTAFPQYRLDELEGWTRRQTFEMYAMAEWVLRELRGLNIEIKTRADEAIPPLPRPPVPQ